MNDQAGSGGFLRECFREFAAELIVLKRRAAKGGTAEELSIRMKTLLNRQGSKAERMGGVPYFDEARYVMAALADEAMLHMVNWEGKGAWRNQLLETDLYGTKAAGQRVFKRIDELLAKGDPVQRELATIYLQALCLDFQGKFRRRKDQEAWAGYRERLYRFVGQGGLNGDKPMFRQAYAHTLGAGAGRRLPGVGRWVLAIVGLLVLYLIASQAIWWVHTSPLQDIICGPIGTCLTSGGGL